MANDINVVVLLGRLTRDCDYKTTSTGVSVCRFSVAVNRRKKNGDKWEDEANFFDVVLMGKSAESLQSYLTKGRQVSVEGELRQNRWEADGQAHSKIEIFANNVQLLSSPVQGAEVSTPVSGTNVAASSSVSAPVGPESFDDAGIPF